MPACGGAPARGAFASPRRLRERLASSGCAPPSPIVVLTAPSISRQGSGWDDSLAAPKARLARTSHPGFHARRRHEQTAPTGLGASGHRPNRDKSA